MKNSVPMPTRLKTFLKCFQYPWAIRYREKWTSFRHIPPCTQIWDWLLEKCAYRIPVGIFLLNRPSYLELDIRCSINSLWNKVIMNNESRRFKKLEISFYTGFSWQCIDVKSSWWNSSIQAYTFLSEQKEWVHRNSLTDTTVNSFILKEYFTNEKHQYELVKSPLADSSSV